MGKKERDEKHKEKSHRKHKHHKSKRKGNLRAAVVPEEVVEVDVEYQSQLDSSSIFNPANETIVYGEENIDIEVEEVTLDYSMEEEPTVEKVGGEKTKKSNKKQDVVVQTPPPKASTSNPNTNAKKAKRRRDSGTSSEEERWLTAIESGKLEEVEDVELRKIKDPKLMTARQRAMYDRNNETESVPGFTETLIALPTGYKEKEKPQTAEEIQKAALKTLKRKQQADEKREKDKKKTMERLLKKQESKNRSSAKPKSVKGTTPMISYKSTADGAFIQLPVGVEFPLQFQERKAPRPRQLCGIHGCGQPKVYNCSKTNLPLCSFACYQKRREYVKEIIC